MELPTYLLPNFDASSQTVPQLRGILSENEIDFPPNSKKKDLIAIFNEHKATIKQRRMEYFQIASGDVAPEKPKAKSRSSRVKPDLIPVETVSSSEALSLADEDDSPVSMLSMPRGRSPGKKAKKSRLSGVYDIPITPSVVQDEEEEDAGNFSNDNIFQDGYSKSAMKHRKSHSPSKSSRKSSSFLSPSTNSISSRSNLHDSVAMPAAQFRSHRESASPSSFRANSSVSRTYTVPPDFEEDQFEEEEVLGQLELQPEVERSLDFEAEYDSPSPSRNIPMNSEMGQPSSSNIRTPKVVSRNSLGRQSIIPASPKSPSPVKFVKPLSQLSSPRRSQVMRFEAEDDFDEMELSITEEESALRVIHTVGSGFKVFFILGLMIVAAWTGLKTHAGLCDDGFSINERIIQRDNLVNHYVDQLAALPSKLPPLPTSITTHPYYHQLESYMSEIAPYIPSLPNSASISSVLPACAPCPPHAICSKGKLQSCTSSDYIITPGLVPVGPFFPTCEPDNERVAYVVEQAAVLNSMLKRWRGDVICNGGKHKGGTEAENFGIEKEMLEEMILSGSADKESHKQILRDAIEDLVGSGEIIKEFTFSGKTYYAAKESDMTLICRVKVESIKIINRSKGVIASIFALILSYLYLKRKVSVKSEESKKVRSLVAQSLKKLQEISQKNALDPVLNPRDSIASAQLRDLLLEDILKVAERRRIWSKVEKAVQGNSNVRTVEGEWEGEAGKGWKWVG